jgi:hypothetical protein
MARKNLTEAMVARLKAPTDRQFILYYDALVPNLLLRVSSKGRKTWCARHYKKARNANGKRVTIPTTHALGVYPILKVKEAREQARQFLVNPAKALAQAEDGSFREVAENFLKRHVEVAGLRSQKDTKRTNIIFHNATSKAVHLYWINYRGRRESYGSIAPGQTHSQPTYRTHPWLVTDHRGKCLNVYFADVANNAVTIML